MTKLLAWIRNILDYPLNPFERLMVAWLTALTVFYLAGVAPRMRGELSWLLR